MIKSLPKKVYICEKCGKETPKWVGCCPSCRSWNTMIESVTAPKQYHIPKQSEKRKAQMVELEPQSDILNNWYSMQREIALKGDCRCMECGKDIRWDLQQDKTWINRRCLAHIIGKAKHPSTSTHIENVLFLCWTCHSEWDSSWSKAMSMNVFDIAVEKVKKFREEIKEQHSKLPIQFFT